MLQAHPRAAALLALLALVSACGSEAPDPLEEACRDVTCNPGRCVLTSDGPACLCDPGHHADGLACVADPPPPDPDPCEPNPCTEPHRTVCTVQGEAAQCGCDAGYLWQNGQCVVLTRPTCAAEPWPGGDAFEPDDCPERALIDFPMGMPQTGRTLAPAGDVDWYRLPVRAGFTYRIQAQGDGLVLPLYLDILTSEGLQPLVADHRGTEGVEVSFKAPDSQPVLVRLSTFDANATGAYTLTLEEQRQDDYADTAEGAVELRAGGVVVSGGVQFQGDVDVHVLPLEAGMSAVLDARTSPEDPVELRLELLSPDGATVLRQIQGREARLALREPTSGRYLLRVRADNGVSRVAYRLSFRQLGPDDHGDDAAVATSLSAPPVTQEASFERSLDVDAFTFVPVPGRQYRTRCFLRSGAGWCQQLLFRQGELPSGFWNSDDLELRAVDATPIVVLVRAGSGMPGTYTFMLQDLGVDDHADTAASATPITVGGPAVTGTLALRADIDVLTFTAQARRIYSLRCTSPTGQWISIQAKDPAGQGLGQSSITIDPVLFQAGQDGPHTLWLSTYGSFAAGAWSCQLTEAAMDDHGGARADASPLQDGQGSGELQYPGDVDAFSAPTQAGRLYRATLTPGGFRSMGLTVFSSDGATLANGSASSSPAAFLFKAATATTVFSVQSFSSSSMGTYSLRLEEAGTDDHGDTPATATPLTLPGSLIGTLQFQNDVDVFSFAVTGGRVYRVACTGTGAEWLTLSAREGTDEVVASAYRTLLHRASANGTLSVAVSNGTAYDCTAQDVGTDDLPDTAEGAQELSAPALGSGTLETYRDVDVFTFRPTQGRVYRFGCTRVSCTVRVRGPDGQVLAENSGDWNTTGSLGWEAGTQAWVSLEVAASSMVGAYDYSLEDVGTDDHGDVSATATALAAGTVQVGAMFESIRDVDAFSFPATAGHIYSVRCVRTGSSWCDLKVKDPTGNAVPAAHAAVVSGRYLIEVSSGSTTGLGTYTLHVEDLGPDDHANTAAGATPLPPGNTPVAGRLETFDDVDVFALSVTAPRAYRLVCQASQALSSCKVNVRTPGGTLVAASDSFSRTAVSFEAPATGTLLVEVSAAFSQHAGTYTLSLEDLGLDDAGDTLATARPLTLGVPRPGRFEKASDVDVYSVQLTGGQRYWVEVSSDVRFQLSAMDASGTIIPLDFARVLAPTTSGTYYLHFAAQESGTYQVEVESGF
ncbi:hypothetical protein ACLESD_06705 [Pyxidicoccus sp. 3LFB2]